MTGGRNLTSYATRMTSQRQMAHLWYVDIQVHPSQGATGGRAWSIAAPARKLQAFAHAKRMQLKAGHA